MTEVTDNSTFDLKSGFYLDTSGMKDPYGIYLCTSTPDTDDHTDMVRYHVNPVQGNAKIIDAILIINVYLDYQCL